MRCSTLPAIVFVSLAVGRMAARDQLIRRADLYAAAAYEDALTVLNRMLIEPGSPEDRPRIEQYRAFCLLALGRSADAEQAIETLVTVAPGIGRRNPMPRPACGPHSRTFAGACSRVIQQRYAAAKQAYDRAGLRRGCRRIPGRARRPRRAGHGAAVANRSPLSDIRTLATGFHELAVVAATPPPPPPAPHRNLLRRSHAPAPGPPSVYTGGCGRRGPGGRPPDAAVVSAEGGAAYMPPPGGVLEVVIREAVRWRRASCGADSARSTIRWCWRRHASGDSNRRRGSAFRSSSGR